MKIPLVSPNSKIEVQEAYNFVKNILKFSKDHPRSLDSYLIVFQKNPKYIHTDWANIINILEKEIEKIQ